MNFILDHSWTLSFLIITVLALFLWVINSTAEFISKWLLKKIINQMDKDEFGPRAGTFFKIKGKLRRRQ